MNNKGNRQNGRQRSFLGSLLMNIIVFWLIFFIVSAILSLFIGPPDSKTTNKPPEELDRLTSFEKQIEKYTKSDLLTDDAINAVRIYTTDFKSNLIKYESTQPVKLKDFVRSIDALISDWESHAEAVERNEKNTDKQSDISESLIKEMQELKKRSAIILKEANSFMQGKGESNPKASLTFFNRSISVERDLTQRYAKSLLAKENPDLLDVLAFIEVFENDTDVKKLYQDDTSNKLLKATELKNILATANAKQKAITGVPAEAIGLLDSFID